MSHPSHKTRYSDSSLYDEVCTQCGVTDRNGMELLDRPCSRPPATTQTAYGAAVKELEQIAEELVEPAEPKQAVEMVPGKKYLLVIKAPEQLSQETMRALEDWGERFRTVLRERGIDAEVVVSGLPLEIYELNAKAKCPENF